MKHYLDDTIAQIATPLGTGGISIIRISGNDCLNILSKIFTNKQEKETHRVYYGHIVSDKNEIIDEVLVTTMFAPRSYTMENVVEINCHGGIKTVQKVLQRVLEAGARIAENGEFTKRAFLNGRIDLTEAEAVIDLINAKTDESQKQAVSQLSGALKDKVNLYRDDILTLIANIEASIDYPEHDMEHDNKVMIKEKVEHLSREISRFINTFDMGKVLREGINTVIVGKPNVGKSSLLNAIIDEDKAIVTEIAGTTRDVITEYVNINGILLKMVDTAGIRSTEDIVERIGVEKSIEHAQNAELVLLVLDSSSELTEQDIEVINMTRGKKVITLLNKSDLERKIDKDILVDKYDLTNIIDISAKNKEIETLYNTINEIFFDGELSMEHDVYINNSRHKSCLTACHASLEAVVEGLVIDLPEDLLSIDLNNAYQSLSEILGETYDEDIIDKIFSEFCLGK